MAEYKTYSIECKYKRLIIVTDIHNCHKEWHAETEKRMERLCEALNAEYQRAPYDAILMLGDYSLDFWGWEIGGSYLWEKPVSYTEDFVRRFVPRLPAEVYMIPGNHEQYSEADFIRITGYPREYSIVYGESVFAMLDTFAGGLDPKENSDGVYTGINGEFLAELLKAHPEKRMIICAHDISPKRESEAVRELICVEKRIVCAFTGHTHRDNTLLLPDSFRNLPVFYCGDFSYNGGRSREKNWGYRLLDITDGLISTEYVRV